MVKNDILHKERRGLLAFIDFVVLICLAMILISIKANSMVANKMMAEDAYTIPMVQQPTLQKKHSRNISHKRGIAKFDKTAEKKMMVLTTTFLAALTHKH